MPESLRLLQLLGPGETLMYPAALALGRRCLRRGGQALIAGPLLRYQQEQIHFLDVRWVNLPLRAYGDDAAVDTERGQVARLVQDFQPHLIHAYGLPALRALDLAAGLRAPAVPVVATLSDLVRQEVHGWERMRLRRALGRCRAVTVSSESDLAALAQLDRRLAKRATLLPPAAEVRPVTADFDLDRKRLTLGLRSETAVVGVISPAEAGLGLESLLDAAVTITRDFPNVEFLFVGEGRDQEALALAAHAKGIGGAVVFRGDRADISEIVAALNVLVIPREVSGSIGYALQALALEVPVLAVRTPALASVLEPVDPEAFVPPDDAAALAALLSRRLEILPPPNDDAYDEFGGFTVGELLVQGTGYDLDGIGLEAEWRGDESQRKLAIRRAQERFSVAALTREMFGVYEQVLGA